MTILVATAEDSDSPVAMKLKKMWLKTPVSEEQAAQAVLDPAIGNYQLNPALFLTITMMETLRNREHLLHT